MQNTSHAVMAQRKEPRDSRDDFPTPPWATRGLLEHLQDEYALSSQSCLEPACGAGHMAKVLEEYFGVVHAADAFPYGYGQQRDFLRDDYDVEGGVDWIITNPPFRLGQEFVLQALRVARVGVAVLVRTLFLESVARYQGIFRYTPPTKFKQFAERVPMVRGRLDPEASTATGYAWIVWEKNKAGLDLWMPPCRKKLERPGDYAARPDEAGGPAAYSKEPPLPSD